MKRLAWVAVLLAAASGCGTDVADARPQWRVVVATDAPVPHLGDRLLVEILDAKGKACNACRRQLAAADPGAWPISFGVVPIEGAAPPRVHLVLYRTIVTGPDGYPDSDRVIEAMVDLPSAEGVTEVSAELRMSCFGVLADNAAGTACDPSTGALAPYAKAKALDAASLPAPGSWPPSKTVDCSGAPPDDRMTCIAGGAFLLGTPDFLPDAIDLAPIPEQLVRVSPFWLDVHEMTVGEIRPLVDSGMVAAPFAQAPGDAAMCTYTAAPGMNEAMPVNCMPLATVKEVCAAQGKRLPTEAEWEWAAGNGARETRYPWGDGDPCAHAIVARDASIGGNAACLDKPSDAGLVAGGGPDDVTDTGVHDLGGSLVEPVADDVVGYDDPTCWGPSPALHEDPQCQAPSTFTALRGAGWSSYPYNAQVTSRNGWLDAKATNNIGVRCAK